MMSMPLRRRRRRSTLLPGPCWRRRRAVNPAALVRRRSSPPGRAGGLPRLCAAVMSGLLLLLLALGPRGTAHAGAGAVDAVELQPLAALAATVGSLAPGAAVLELVAPVARGAEPRLGRGWEAVDHGRGGATVVVRAVVVIQSFLVLDMANKAGERSNHIAVLAWASELSLGKMQ